MRTSTSYFVEGTKEVRRNSETIPYKMINDFNVFSIFMEDQIGGNVKNYFVVTKQYDSILIDLKVFEKVR